MTRALFTKYGLLVPMYVDHNHGKTQDFKAAQSVAWEHNAGIRTLQEQVKLWDQRGEVDMQISWLAP